MKWVPISSVPHDSDSWNTLPWVFVGEAALALLCSAPSRLSCNRESFASDPSAEISILKFFGMPADWDEEVPCVGNSVSAMQFRTAGPVDSAESLFDSSLLQRWEIKQNHGELISFPPFHINIFLIGSLCCWGTASTSISTFGKVTAFPVGSLVP